MPQAKYLRLTSQVYLTTEMSVRWTLPKSSQWTSSQGDSLVKTYLWQASVPDGKEGNHRLSSKFTEWMMGLPDGWITDIGLKRNDELKACGNGVVPQQAELALSLLGINDILRGNNE
jgi:hypothetical protein